VFSKFKILVGKSYPLFLLGLGILAYGLWINRLGFYWDDFPLTWIARTYGASGLARYFSTNRPFWGLIYQLTTPLLGTNPTYWQIFALVFRLLNGLLLWQLVRLAWPRHEEIARWAGALLVVYPGFSQQFISVVYGHMLLVLAAFITSQVLMVLALRREKPSLPLLALSWLFSAVNLFSMEYYFLLELTRPVLIWVALGQTSAFPLLTNTRKIKKVLLIFLPYFILLLGVMVWRTYGLGFHTYQPTFATTLRASPFTALLQLVKRIPEDIWTATGLAWSHPFDFAANAQLTPRQAQIFWVVAAAGTIFALLFFIMSRPESGKPRRSDWLGLLAFSLPVLIAAGGPYWLTGLPIAASFPFDRFTLSFMTGAVLISAGLLAFVPLPRWVKIIPLALVLGFSAALQYRHSLEYYRDWSMQRTLFWQMTWRMPGLLPGTILLSNELPMEHYSDNSLTAPLNWIYAPENRSEEMSYVFYYPTVRLGRGLPELKAGLQVKQDYLAAHFTGSTDQVVVVYFQPPGCLRVMDPEVEADIWVVPTSLRETLKLSTTVPILPAGQARPPQELYGSEPQRNWCYYFEKADLARQQGNWETAAALGDDAFALGDYPNDPMERFPFIEAYAHTGRWSRALELTRDTRDIAPLYAQLGCKLWTRIEREAPDGEEKNISAAEARELLGCKGK
jgi:hypothetical protein